MKKINIIALLMLTCLGMVSCGDTLDDNINPDKAHIIDAKNGLPTVIYLSLIHI